MSTRSPHSEAPTGVDLDPRWQLVERIVSSQCFARSERLSSFLTCVCDLARRGELEHINEQYIGKTVFGRRPDYDPGADSIVRSHASRLRHRLTQYFAEEGARGGVAAYDPEGLVSARLPIPFREPGGCSRGRRRSYRRPEGNPSCHQDPLADDATGR